MKQTKDLGNLPQLGIDIAKKTFDVTLLIDKQPHKKFPNNGRGFVELLQWLAKHNIARVWACMEHTNKYWKNLAKFLARNGHAVSVLNPATFASYAKGQKRAKGDRKDSFLLGTYCRDWKPRIWQAPTEAEEKLKEVNHARVLLKKQLQAAQNHLDTLEFNDAQTVLVSHIEFLNQQIIELEKIEEKTIRSCPRMDEERGRWLRVCGIGPETANSILSDIGTLTKFDRYISLRRMAGLDSVHNQSGTSVNGKEHTSKCGSNRVRANLQMAAMSAMQSNPRFHDFAENLRKKGKLDCVVVTAVANKLLLTMWALSRYEEEFRTDHRPAWLNKNNSYPEMLSCA